MKLLVVLLALVSFCTASAIPLDIPKDNSHYVEGESRYIWMPDGEGQLHLVDLEEPVDENLLKSRNGANNEYWLYTRLNPTTPQILVHNDITSVSDSNYSNLRATVVIVHGWNNNGNTEMNPLITAAYLGVMDVNVIVVDWRALANSGYITAVTGVPGVGEFIGDFLVWLFNNTSSNWNALHLVGFSLGAHVVGNAGRRTGGLPLRVTGLDPAGPLWATNSNALNQDAGVYVENIHTDGGSLGIMNAIGHVDIYPNGGRHPQPGCLLITCSHGRSTELYASSVWTSNRFVASRCDSIEDAELVNCSGEQLQMGNGIFTNKGVNGMYALTTGSTWPF